jgi:hypothetical protein
MLGSHKEVCEIPEWRLAVDPDGLVDCFVSMSGSWSPLLFSTQFKRLESLLDKLGDNGRALKFYRRILHALKLNSVFGLSLDVPYGSVSVSDFCPKYKELVNDLLCCLRDFSYCGTWTGSPFMTASNITIGRPIERKDLARVLGGFYRAVAYETLRASNKRYYLEKNTWYPLVFDQFLELIPECKLINIWRDPRDVVCSMVSQRWAPSNYIDAAKYLRMIMDRWYIVRQQLPDTSFIDVRYEDLVTQTEKTLDQITSFSGLPLATKPYDLSSRSIGRWKHELTRSQVSEIQPFIARELAGYV